MLVNREEEPIQALSSLPGRVRWKVPLILRRPRLAEAVSEAVNRHPEVTEVKANPITGNVLVRFDPELATEQVAIWLREAVREHRWVEEGGPKTPRPGLPLLKRLIASTEDHRSLRRKVVATAIADGLAEAVPPLLVGLAVDTVSTGPTSLLGRIGFKTATSRVFALGGVGLGFWALAAIIEYHKERSSAELAEIVRHDLRSRLYEHIQTLDVSAIESREVGEWLAVLDGDVNQVYSFMRAGVDPMVAMASNVVIVGSAFMVVSPAMGLVQLAVIPPLMISSKVMLKPLRERMVRAKVDGERVSATMGGNLSGMATVVGFNAQDREAERVREASERHLESAREAHALSAAYVPTLRSIVGTGFVTTLAWGAARVNAGTMTISGLDTLAYSQLRLMSALARAGTSVENFQRTSAALERIYEALDETPAIRDGDHPVNASELKGEVVFSDITFGYDASRPVLRGLTLRCPAGKVTGIVGATGAGKSTLLKMLPRMYDPQGGTVRLDGRDVRELRLAELRSSIAMVSQQITLFSGSIHENIAFGRPDASRNEVVAAARVAEALDFIEELPDGFDTMIGFGGQTLSGGQRQRLAIARAILAERPILLFDEATSSLDHATEAALQRSLEAATAGRTTLIVAHRLSTVRHADVIYVLDDGRVVEQGTHGELLERNGLYANMWKVQIGEREQAPAVAS